MTDAGRSVDGLNQPMLGAPLSGRYGANGDGAMPTGPRSFLFKQLLPGAREVCHRVS